MGDSMRKFCCELWKSCINEIQEFAEDKVCVDALVSNAQFEAIKLWSNYCPSCGLSLSSPDTPQGVHIKHLSAKPTHPHPLVCRSCNGTGNAGGLKDSKAKCTPCLGTGKIVPEKEISDALVKIEDLKNKIKRENKPIDPESLNPSLIK